MFYQPCKFRKDLSAIDVEIIGLTEITKNIFKQQQNISSTRLRFAQSGSDKKFQRNLPEAAEILTLSSYIMAANCTLGRSQSAIPDSYALYHLD